MTSYNIRSNCIFTDEGFPFLKVDSLLAQENLDHPGVVETPNQSETVQTQHTVNYIEVIDKVVQSGKFNFEGERIQVNNKSLSG